MDNENFEKYLTKEEIEEIAKGLERGEEDIKAGRVSYWADLKKELGRYMKEIEEETKSKLHN